MKLVRGFIYCLQHLYLYSLFCAGPISAAPIVTVFFGETICRTIFASETVSAFVVIAGNLLMIVRASGQNWERAGSFGFFFRLP
jgi:hypothetical protein